VESEIRVEYGLSATYPAVDIAEDPENSLIVDRV
jgi:hypothetical protein